MSIPQLVQAFATDILGVGELGDVVAIGVDADASEPIRSRSWRVVASPVRASRWARLRRGQRIEADSRSADLVVVGRGATGRDPVPWWTAREARRICRPGGHVLVERDISDEPVDSLGDDSRVDWFVAGLQLVHHSRSYDGWHEVLVLRRRPLDPRELVHRGLSLGGSRRVAAAVALADALPPSPEYGGIAQVLSDPRPAGASHLEGLDRAASLWDEAAQQAASAAPEISQRREWQAHPRSQAHLAARSGGGFGAWLRQHSTRGARAVSIGCGRAPTEVELVADGQLSSVDLFDISAGSLEVAAEHAARLGVSDRVRCHVGPFDPTAVDGPLDLVLFISSLHHIEDLEGTLGALHPLMAPGGVLVAEEYVGPARFGFPDEHLHHARQLYRIIDRSLRHRDPELPVPTVEDVVAVDPTEAVRSDEILEQLEAHFSRVAVAPVGGAVAFPLWLGLRHDALFETALGDDLVAHILDLDATLTDSGVVPPYFAYLAAYKD